MEDKNGEGTIFTRKTNRRGFLKILGGGAIGVAGVTGALETASYIADLVGGSNTASAEKPAQTPTLTASPTPQPIETLTPTPTEIPVKKETSEELVERVVYNSPLFKNCNSQEKKEALKIVKDQIKHFQKPETKKNSGSVEKYKPLIETGWQVAAQVLEKTDFPLDPIIKDIILPLILVESAGEAKAKSPKFAYGPCQLTQIAIDDIKKMLDISYTIDDLQNDSRKNITAAILYLARLHKFFGDPGLTAIAYNMGIEGLRKKVGNHLQYQTNASSATVEKYFSYDEKKKKWGAKDVIEGYGINPIRIINTQPLLNEAEVYVPRLVAASCLLEAAKSDIKELKLE